MSVFILGHRHIEYIVELVSMSTSADELAEIVKPVKRKKDFISMLDSVGNLLTSQNLVAYNERYGTDISPQRKFLYSGQYNNLITNPYEALKVIDCYLHQVNGTMQENLAVKKLIEIAKRSIFSIIKSSDEYLFAGVWPISDEDTSASKEP